MRYAAYDIRGVWLFDFLSENDDPEEVLREAQDEDEQVAQVIEAD